MFSSDHAAEPEGDDDEGEPAERRGLPVAGAPSTHARREVVRVLVACRNMSVLLGSA
jgi:hypothetical protein